MKAHNISKSILALSLVVIAVSSCQEKIGGGFTKGEAVKFTIGTDVSDTKAAYSGDKNTAGTIERIDWETGDLIRIYCAQASGIKSADYAVTSVNTPSSGSEKSTAFIESAGGAGLLWGEGEHIFYAVYPSPEEESGITTSISPYTYGGTKGSVSKSIEGATVTAKLPAKQAIAQLTATTPDYVASPNLENMLMTAKSGPYTVETFPKQDKVFLSFIPLTTAVQFTITNQTGADIKVQSVSLISGNGKTTAPAINGAFSVNLDSMSKPADIDLGASKITYSREYPACTRDASLDATSNMSRRTSTISFDSPVPLTYNATASAAGKLTFTFFLTPTCNFDDITFKVVMTDSDGSNTRWMSTKLGYTDGTGVLFPRFKKTTVNGVFIPGGAQWTVKYGPTVEPWNNPGDTPIGPMPEVSGDPIVTSWDTGIEGELELNPVNYSYEFHLTTETDAIQTFTNKDSDSPVSTISVTSEKISDGSSEQIDWKIKSYQIGKDEPVTVDGTSFTGKGGLNVEKEGQTLKVKALSRSLSNPGSHSYWVGTNGGWSPEDWTSATSSAPIDLSTFDAYSDTRDAHGMTTANCYIIRHAGTYKLPLVYGNAMKDGNPNEKSYKPGDIGEPSVLETFVNHLNEKISSPFIENNGEGCIPTGAAVIWQDEAVIVKNLKIVDASGYEIGTPSYFSRTDYNYSKNDVHYLQFDVDQSTICQNNALICIYRDLDGDSSYDEGEAVWSWHIWTTNDPALLEDPVPFKNFSGNSVNLFPAPSLGWVESKMYPSRENVRIVLEQLSSGKTCEVLAIQPKIANEMSNGTYFQFGRKDPIAKQGNTGAGEKSLVQGEFKKASGPYTIGKAISCPGTFVTPSTGGDSWSVSMPQNIWNGAGQYKTIYDPCPVGYTLPGMNAFSGLTVDGEEHSISWNPDKDTYLNYDSASSTNYEYFFYSDGWHSGRTVRFVFTKLRDISGIIPPLSGFGYWYNMLSSATAGSSAYFIDTGTIKICPHGSNPAAVGNSILPVLEK